MITQNAKKRTAMHASKDEGRIELTVCLKSKQQWSLVTTPSPPSPPSTITKKEENKSRCRNYTHG